MKADQCERTRFQGKAERDAPTEREPRTAIFLFFKASPGMTVSERRYILEKGKEEREERGKESERREGEDGGERER